jgi:hypothetical protein
MPTQLEETKFPIGWTKSCWEIERKDITIQELGWFMNEVKSPKYKAPIETARLLLKEQGKAAYSKVKVKLPAICFGRYSGSVSNDNYIPNSSCIFNGDIDGLKDIEEAERVKDLFTSHHNTVYCILSPSGLGVKFGINVDPIKDDAHYKQLFAYMKVWVKDEIDNSIILDERCKDIRRLCFQSYDPSAYLNLGADILPIPSESLVESIKAPIPTENGLNKAHIDTITANLTNGLGSVKEEIVAVITNMMLKAPDGDRHGTRINVSRLAGGYVAGGLLGEDEALELLTALSDRIAEGGATSNSELKTIMDGFNFGLKAPLTLEDYRKQHGYDLVVFDPAVSNGLVLTKNAKGTRILPTLDNIHQALSTPEFSRYGVGYDTFKEQMMYYEEAHGTKWQPMDDEVYTKLRIHLPKLSFEEIPAPIMRDAVNYTARQNKFDSAQEWLNGLLVWDGITRVELFNAKYFKTDDTPYTRAASLYMWTALAARVLCAGCQCDMVPVYEGAQGDGKSSAVAAIAPRADMTTEISFLDDEDKSSRKMRGCVVAEISELRGINTKDEESIKAFITRRFDRWVPKYKEFAVEAPRRSIFIGTTNNKEFLGDPTGQRRWLPISCGKVDVAGIVKDRDQLWAEAAVIYRAKGICWEDAERLAVDVHKDFMFEDVWLMPIKAYLNMPVHLGAQFALTTAHILLGALDIDIRNQKRCDVMRVAAVLKVLGYRSERRMFNGERIRFWVCD